jgi:HEAT repeat protein
VTDDGATAALRRAAADDSALVRAAAVLALGARDEGVDAYLSDPAPLPRVAAAVVIAAPVGQLDGEDPSAVPDAVLEIVERDTPASLELIRRLPMDASDPLTWVINALAPYWQLQIRLVSAWMRHPSDEVRRGAVYAAEVPMQTWRPAAAQLVSALAAALSDPSDDVRWWAGCRLAGAGRAAAAVADELWAAVERGPVAYNTAGASALTALSRLHDPRADAFLASSLSPRHMGSTGDLDLGGLGPAIGPLGPWSTACRTVIVDAIGRAAAGNDRIGLILAAGRMAAPAADLVPVLRQQATSHPHATSRVLGDLGPAAGAALPELTALRTSADLVVRVNAARAMWRITGDVDGLLTVLRAEINHDHALQVLAEVGPAGAALAELLPPMFDGDDEWRAVCAAVAYWHLTGDGAPVVPVLVRYAQCGPRGMVAVRCLADVGPAAAAAIPLLREAVDSPYRQVGWAVGDTAILEDEAWMDACAQALARIQI